MSVESEVEKSIGEKLWGELWDDVSGGLAELMSRFADAAKESAEIVAELKAELTGELADRFDHWSDLAKDMARRADEAGMAGKKIMQEVSDAVAQEFANHANKIRSQGLDAWADANKHLAEAAQNAVKKGAAQAGGTLIDLADIFMNLIGGNYYGGLSSALGAIGGFLVFARYAGPWGFIAGVAASWLLEKLAEDALNYLDPLNINPAVADDYQRAYAFRPACEPLVLDLDGDGIESLPANGQILFDHDADGTKHATGWINSDDALLALDINGDGHITSGRELFGDQTLLSDGSRAKNGFDALAQHDRNHDQVIDHRDAIFNDLRLWRDYNANGESETGELHTLTELGIQSIRLDATARNTRLPGAQLIADATFTRNNGQSGQVGALDFDHNPFFREDFNRACVLLN